MATYITQENDQRRELSDEEVLTHFPPQVELSAKKTTVKADGDDFTTIHVQLKSVPLSDDKQADLALVHKVMLQVAGKTVELTTDESGHATHEIECSDEGEYSITTQHLNSNTLVITAV